MRDPLEIGNLNEKRGRLEALIFLALLSISIGDWLFDWNLLGEYDGLLIALVCWLGWWLLFFPLTQQPDDYRAFRRSYSPLQWYVIAAFPLLLVFMRFERFQQFMPAHYWLLLFVAPLVLVQGAGFVARRMKRHDD